MREKFIWLTGCVSCVRNFLGCILCVRSFLRNYFGLQVVFHVWEIFFGLQVLFHSWEIFVRNFFGCVPYVIKFCEKFFWVTCCGPCMIIFRENIFWLTCCVPCVRNIKRIWATLGITLHQVLFKWSPISMWSKHLVRHKQ